MMKDSQEQGEHVVIKKMIKCLENIKIIKNDIMKRGVDERDVKNYRIIRHRYNNYMEEAIIRELDISKFPGELTEYICI